MAPVCLKLGGKAFSLHPKSPSADKILKFLDKAPADELFTIQMLAKESGVALGTLRKCATLSKEETSYYSHKVGTIRYYGNPKAIAQLKKETAQ